MYNSHQFKIKQTHQEHDRWCWQKGSGPTGLDNTTQHSFCSPDLKVVLSVQHPGGEFLLWGPWYAPQTLGVKGQAHDRLGVGFGVAKHGPLGYIPQYQGTVLVSSQQERSRPRLWLKGRKVGKKEEGQGDRKKEEERDLWGKMCVAVECSKTHREHCMVLEAERSRGYHVGSSHWHSEGHCGLHSSACCSVFPALHYTTPHFAPHLYYWATGLTASTDAKSI